MTAAEQPSFICSQYPTLVLEICLSQFDFFFIHPAFFTSKRLSYGGNVLNPAYILKDILTVCPNLRRGPMRRSSSTCFLVVDGVLIVICGRRWSHTTRTANSRILTRKNSPCYLRSRSYTQCISGNELCRQTYLMLLRGPSNRQSTHRHGLHEARARLHTTSGIEEN